MIVVHPFGQGHIINCLISVVSNRHSLDDLSVKGLFKPLVFDSWKQSSCLLIEQKLSEYVIFKFIHNFLGYTRLVVCVNYLLTLANVLILLGIIRHNFVQCNYLPILESVLTMYNPFFILLINLFKPISVYDFFLLFSCTKAIRLM
jgi:hypothetical protein